ncbi:CAMK/CAMKL/GIN4 protein kinase, variant 2 [Coprinopsis cinerea AmutBmut pab1-1]|nr:CAMK/CAMKL/GIN4 protein kinase, variant 2 [Coprinopsis cinerea AmutBmut pab1-1]
MFSPPSSPPASSKTHAFFASSFAASPPPPRPPLSLKKSDNKPTAVKNRDDNGTNPPPAASPGLFSSAKTSRFNVSRIFPSRYARSRRDSAEQQDVQNAFSSNALRRKPDFLFIDVDGDADPNEIHHIDHRETPFKDVFLSLPTAPSYHDRAGSDSSLSPPSSISSSSSHAEIRLPTPPPPPPLLTASSNASDNEFTPRPADLEPSIAAVQPQELSPLSPLSEDNSIPADTELHPGDVIADSSFASATSPSLRLLRPLGQGAFSAVWLAEDLSSIPLVLSSKRSVRDLKRQASLQSKGSVSRKSSLKSPTSSRGVSRNSSMKRFMARVTGTQPSVDSLLLDGHVHHEGRETTWTSPDGHLHPMPPSSMHPSPSPSSSISSLPSPEVGLGASLSRQSSTSTRRSATSRAEARVVAVKLTPRRPEPNSPLTEERTRVGFIREVEVLRHISHPNITPLLAHFSTPTYHVLVLPYLKGGDLLSLVNNDAVWGRLSESVLRRIWCEICRAVGWMHSVGIVHRDIKLENVLLTWDGLQSYSNLISTELSSTPTESSILSIPRPTVADLPTPIVKLTDFGLSRFIDIGNGERGQGEMLNTRCGSEAYAAPELVMGGGPRGVYDGRETDAWACGVVLYALVGRKLPFGEGVGIGMDGGHGTQSHINGERVHPPGYSSRKHAVERRAWLMRIAKGEYEWPEVPSDAAAVEDGDGELVGPRLALSEGAKRVVGRLLVRDPKKRARIVDLWEDDWMRGDEIGLGMWEAIQLDRNASDRVSDGSGEVKPATNENPITVLKEDGLDDGEWEPLDEDEYLEEEDEHEGWLLDEQSISSIVRQEVV